MAGEQTYLSWNVANWISVLIMAAVGFAVIGFAVKTIRKRSDANDVG